MIEDEVGESSGKAHCSGQKDRLQTRVEAPSPRFTKSEKSLSCPTALSTRLEAATGCRGQTPIISLNDESGFGTPLTSSELSAPTYGTW